MAPETQRGEVLPETICGVIVGGIWHDPIACAFPKLG